MDQTYHTEQITPHLFVCVYGDDFATATLHDTFLDAFERATYLNALRGTFDVVGG
ncbi:hypothetical protein [Pseudoxanthomonas sp. JBR18]|uniref:hypothetical protein n=1 Tax=Pseudoxanthomonas sp. JBR18 TaxID=2969308 RepID=UPI00230639D2|nr:hypothetical protein [Pseudoxanthomonas sp. JBR18]WCE04465.1 hypothetical protein PJ250_00180 [Pseudoxanthomonas sp. JBR18]